MELQRAELYGRTAYVPSVVEGVNTYLVDSKGWFPFSSPKIKKEHKNQLYQRLKTRLGYKDLSRRQKMFAKHVIKKSVVLDEFCVSEAIYRAKGIEV